MIKNQTAEIEEHQHIRVKQTPTGYELDSFGDGTIGEGPTMLAALADFVGKLAKQLDDHHSEVRRLYLLAYSENIGSPDCTDDLVPYEELVQRLSRLRNIWSPYENLENLAKMIARGDFETAGVESPAS